MTLSLLKSIVMLSVIYSECHLCRVSFMLCVIYVECLIQALYGQCRNAQCEYVECHYALC
jgi:hypothetical protein